MGKYRHRCTRCGKNFVTSHYIDKEGAVCDECFKLISSSETVEEYNANIKARKNADIIIERVWAMPNHKTFTIKPIKELLKYEFNNEFVDPFPFPFKTDALEYLKTFKSKSVDKLAFDPPYSPRQLKEMYGGAGLDYTTNSSYWANMKKEISRVVCKGGKVISFGWNSGGIGKKYGFEIQSILLVPHGGSHNDTICTVEIKI